MRCQIIYYETISKYEFYDSVSFIIEEQNPFPENITTMYGTFYKLI